MRQLLALFVIGSALSFGGTIFTDNPPGGQVNGTTIAVNDMTGFNTTGNMMGGMTITGTFDSGAVAVCVWVNGGGSQGGCTADNGDGYGFEFFQSGTTFSNSFQLTNITSALGDGLLSLFFDGLPGFTAFDRAFDDNDGNSDRDDEGTDGSDIGFDASGSVDEDDDDLNVDGEATYMDQIATMGNGPVGDLFARLLIQFDGNGLLPGDEATMRIDTDNIGERDGDPGSGVPEPSTFAMLGAALAGLAIFRRRRA